MSSDISGQTQTPSALLSLQGQVDPPADMLSQRLSSDLGQTLIFQTDPEPPEAFSLETLLEQFPDPQDRFDACWCWLATLITEHVPCSDYRNSGLVALDGLVAYSSFAVSNTTRRYFTDHIKTEAN